MSNSSYTNADVSLKIRLTAFLGAVAVVVIHSNPLESIIDPLWAGRVGNWIGYLQRWAVPYFFMVSGFFFDRGYASVARGTKDFYRTKFKSLVVPYCLWGAVYGALMMTPILMWVNHAKGVSACEGTIFQDCNVLAVLDRVLGLTGACPNGALWYVRLCLIFFLFAPVWRLIRRHAKFLIPCLALVFIVVANPFVRGYSADGVVIAGKQITCSWLGMGYLFIGMSASVLRIEQVRVKPGWALVSLLAWCAWTHLTIEAQYGALSVVQSLVVWNHKVSGLLLICCLWCAVDILLPVLSRIPLKIIGMSFWIYCMHHPITAYVGALLHAILGRTLAAEVLRMLLSAPITLAICIACGLLVQRLTLVYSTLTGGRTR